uniref:Uncharacterized protein n=1 Tax=Tetradesmus obliquus TaxID=3088 RepID=A0A383V4X6_TETOB|eukprot:jgi/Sobl393_1/1359/SZX59832.1
MFRAYEQHGLSHDEMAEYAAVRHASHLLIMPKMHMRRNFNPRHVVLEECAINNSRIFCSVLYEKTLTEGLQLFNISTPSTADYKATVQRSGDGGRLLTLSYGGQGQHVLADEDRQEAFEQGVAVLHEQAGKIVGRFPVPASAAAAAAAASPLPFSVDPATPQLAAMTQQEWVLN